MIEGGIWDIMMNLIFLSKMEKEKNKYILTVKLPNPYLVYESKFLFEIANQIKKLIEDWNLIKFQVKIVKY